MGIKMKSKVAGLRKVENIKVGNKVCGIDYEYIFYTGVVIKIHPRLRTAEILRDDRREGSDERYKGFWLWEVCERDDKFWGADDANGFLYHQRIDWMKRLK